MKFKDLVETGSEGRMEVVIFPGGQMGSVRIHLNSARRGDIEGGSTTSNFTRAMPEFAGGFPCLTTRPTKRVFESRPEENDGTTADEPYGNRLYGTGLPQFLQQQASHTD
ncbi:MAG: hypothetical protein ACLTW9_00025 [Enterocloster sp.]